MPRGQLKQVVTREYILSDVKHLGGHQRRGEGGDSNRCLERWVKVIRDVASFSYLWLKHSKVNYEDS